jgi:hypothetical protein
MRPLEVERLPLEQLTPHPENPRNGDTDTIAASLAAHGQFKPFVVANDRRTILAGAHTVAAMLELGWTHGAAVVWPVDPLSDEALAIVVDDNHAHEQGRTDEGLALPLIERLRAAGVRTAVTDEQADALRTRLRHAEHTPVGWKPGRDRDAAPVPPVLLGVDVPREHATRHVEGYDRAVRPAGEVAYVARMSDADRRELVARLAYHREHTGLETDTEALLDLVRRGTRTALNL